MWAILVAMRVTFEVLTAKVVKGLLRSDFQSPTSGAPTPMAVLDLSPTHFGGC
jgi:hypothetical protein